MLTQSGDFIGKEHGGRGQQGEGARRSALPWGWQPQVLWLTGLVSGLL